MEAHPPAHGLSRWTAVAVVGGLLGISALIGRRNAPDRTHRRIRSWYRALAKPRYTPPDAVFGAMWPILEVGLAFGGYRVLRKPPSPQRQAAIRLYVLNNAMIGGWTELFFARRAIGGAAAASGAMLVAGAGYAVVAGKVDRGAQATALPYVAWLGFATLLSSRIWQANRRC